jgi:hypothetical protein
LSVGGRIICALEIVVVPDRKVSIFALYDDNGNEDPVGWMITQNEEGEPKGTLIRNNGKECLSSFYADNFLTNIERLPSEIKEEVVCLREKIKSVIESINEIWPPIDNDNRVKELPPEKRGEAIAEIIEKRSSEVSPGFNWLAEKWKKLLPEDKFSEERVGSLYK